MEKKSMGSFLTALRKASGLTQKQLAEMIGVTDKAVSKWEHGVTYPDITMIPDIAKLLGVSVAHLFGEAAPSSDEERWSIYIVKHR